MECGRVLGRPASELDLEGCETVRDLRLRAHAAAVLPTARLGPAALDDAARPKVALPPGATDGLTAMPFFFRTPTSSESDGFFADKPPPGARAQGPRVPLLAARRFTIKRHVGLRGGPARSARRRPAGAGARGRTRVAEWRRLRAIMSRTKRKRVEPDEPRGAGARRALRRVAEGGLVVVEGRGGVGKSRRLERVCDERRRGRAGRDALH